MKHFSSFRGAVLICASLIILLASCASAGSTAAKTEASVQSYDVVVVGAGGAGLSAAIEAKEAGASVVILEKMPMIGGNTLLSGGEMNAPANWVQQKLGIKDSAELFYQDTLKGGDNKADAAVVRALADNALVSAEWLRDKVGVKFDPENLFQFGGHSVKRALIPEGQTGYELVSKLKAMADALKIPFKMETKATALIVENGRVAGVKATTAKGQQLTFKARKGVVLATGGFGANVEMRKKYNPVLDEHYMTTDSPGSTGDGIVMAEAAGAALANMQYIQTYPICNPKTGIISLVADTRFDGAILINQDGKRFVEELDRRDVISNAILAQKGGYCYQLWNEPVARIENTDIIHKDEYNQLVAQKLLYKVDTLEEAAKAFDIPYDSLKETVDRVTGFAQTGKDTDFNYRATFLPLDKGPYYIMKAVPSVHHTMGGLVIDPATHVKNASGALIPGLYAAGEVTGVVHGSNRLGGNAIADAITFGRIAGENAAAGR